MQVGEAFITVRPDTKGFGPELQRDAERSGKQAASGLSQALTAGIAVAGFTKLIGSASNLQEAMNKTQVTFGEASGSVEQFASTSADSFGISESAALDLAGGLGAMLIPLGTSQEEAASMSTTLLTLAADMGSFNNQDPTEMLERLRSGLAGESEPLRQFGVTLNEARVQQFAWANGIAESGVALTDQQKIMARYGIIMQDTANQQDDFANTADSAANAQRRAAATAEDSAASMGESFLPVYERAVAVVQTLAAAFGALPAPMQTSLVLLGAFAAFKGPLTAAFGVITGSVGALRSALVLTQGAFLGVEVASTSAAAGMALSLGPWAALAAILVGIHTGVIDVTNAMSEADLDTQNVDKMTAAMNEAGSASEGLINHLSDTGEFDPGFFEAMGVSVDTFAAALLGGEDAWDAFVNQVMGNLPEGADLGSWNEALELHRTRALASAGAMEEQGGAARGAAGGMDENADAATENADAMGLLTEAIDAYLDKIQGTEEANVAAADAQRELFNALVTNGATFDANTVKGGENITVMNAWVDAIGGQVTAAADFVAAGGNVEVGQRRANNAIQAGVGNLRALRDANIITQEQFRRYADQLRGLPNRIDVDGGPARREATNTANHTNRVWGDRRFLAHLDADERDAVIAYDHAIRLGNDWAGRIYEAHFNARMAGGIPGQATPSAAGGHRSEGQVLLVGEQGPEIFVPDSAGTVIPNHRAGGTPIGGGMTVVVNVEGNVVGDVDRFADEIAFRAAEKISRGAI